MVKRLLVSIVLIILLVSVIQPALSIKIRKKINKEIQNLDIVTNTDDGSTLFKPPYDNSYSWGDGTDLLDDHAEGTNKYSGAIGVFAHGFVGGATSEGLQIISFYTGREKELSVEVNILYIGGTATVGFASFAGTEKVWRIDDWDNYHRKYIDFWLDWDVVVGKIIDMISLLSGYAPGTIKEAIEIISTIHDFYKLYDALADLYHAGDAKLVRISFDFTAEKGYHTLWLGLRATASGCATGYGCAVMAGQVVNITVHGIAPPYVPEVTGPEKGMVDKNIEIKVTDIDPNNDNIKYQIDWGDGTKEETDFYKNGKEVTLSHTYSKTGEYTIKVKAIDIDLMESEDYGYHKIVIINNRPPEKPIINGPSSGRVGTKYGYTFYTTDPDGDDVYYMIDWGDGETMPWDGPYNSGEELRAFHSWSEKGSYVIRIKAKDIYGEESEWATLEVSMPKNKNIPYFADNLSFFLKVLFEQLHIKTSL